MPLKNDFISASLLDAIEAQQKMLDSLYAPARAIQNQMNLSIAPYAQISNQISQIYLPTKQINELIKASSISIPQFKIPSIPSAQFATFRELSSYQETLQDLNDTLPTQSIADILPLDSLEITNPTNLDFDDEVTSNTESTTIEALTKDKKFITWFRLTFPDFANQPAQVIAKYFFHQILAPLIVQLLLLLISGSFKDE
jgi:hypothetical protein|nr:MAG TPA: hypothetical protein [Caudoviricetes sp.]